MEIDNELKEQLIADVENILCTEINASTKQALVRCFEITIGSRILILTKSDDTKCNTCQFKERSRYEEPCYKCKNNPKSFDNYEKIN